MPVPPPNMPSFFLIYPSGKAVDRIFGGSGAGGALATAVESTGPHACQAGRELGVGSGCADVCRVLLVVSVCCWTAIFVKAVLLG